MSCLCATSGVPLVKPAGASRLHTPLVRALCRTVHIKQPRLEEASRADTIKHKLSINQSAVVINQQSTELKTG